VTSISDNAPLRATGDIKYADFKKGVRMAKETWPNSPNETTGVMQMAIRLSVLGMEPFISKGIADLEDGTLVFRAKFTAKLGKQSAIRRAALKAVNNAFRANGIRAVPKPTSDQRAMAVA
jgi:hypothetical protein